MKVNVTKEFLSTGQMADLCSVTPDTVLKWVKGGKIPANRTAGGHYRIHRSAVLSFLETEEPLGKSDQNGRSYQYCWEFNSQTGAVQEDCQNCIVYRSSALRCYEMSNLPEEAGHAKAFCKTPCDECEYYKTVQGQRINVLVVTDQAELQSALVKDEQEVNYNLRFTDCEYRCSILVENFRPDYIVIDCSLGKKRSLEFAGNLSKDPRIPFVRVILAGNRSEFPVECDKEVFAFIERPFTAVGLANLFATARQ